MIIPVNLFDTSFRPGHIGETFGIVCICFATAIVIRVLKILNDLVENQMPADFQETNFNLR